MIRINSTTADSMSFLLYNTEIHCSLQSDIDGRLSQMFDKGDAPSLYLNTNRYESTQSYNVVVMSNLQMINPYCLLIRS
jgi:hypothetical protein